MKKGGDPVKQKSPMKERLKAYRMLLAEIEIEEQRAKVLQNDDSLTGRRALAGIKDHVRILLSKEDAEYELLTGIINSLPRADQRQIMLARYMDGLTWDIITDLIFGKRRNFKEKRDSYRRQVFRIHGYALINANKMIVNQAKKQGKDE